MGTVKQPHTTPEVFPHQDQSDRLADGSGDVIGSDESPVAERSARFLTGSSDIRSLKLCHVVLVTDYRLGNGSFAAPRICHDQGGVFPVLLFTGPSPAFPPL